MTRLLLASRSASRIAMLSAAGIPFDTDPADVDEETIGEKFEDPDERSMQLARAKALHVSKRNPDRIVLGSDQVAVLEDSGAFLEKPKDAADQVRMLMVMSGKTHAFFPAAALARDGRILVEAKEIVRVTFRAFDEATARRYVETGEGRGSCGGYEIEHKGAQLVARIDGTMFAVMGMPLLSVLDLLKRANVEGAL